MGKLTMTVKGNVLTVRYMTLRISCQGYPCTSENANNIHDLRKSYTRAK